MLQRGRCGGTNKGVKRVASRKREKWLAISYEFLIGVLAGVPQHFYRVREPRVVSSQSNSARKTPRYSAG